MFNKSSIKNLLLVSILILPIATKVLADGQTIKIGILVCLTGSCAQTGQSSLNGASLAIEEINQKSGVLGKKLKMIVEDTNEAQSSANSVTAFRKLTQDQDIHLIIGPTWTTGGMPLVPLIKNKKDLIITSPSLGVADFNKADARIFNTWPHDEESAKAMALWALEKNYKTAAILSAQGEWEATQAKSFKNAFENNGGKILSIEEPLASALNIKAELTRIVNSKPDFIFLIHWDHAAMAARELFSLGWQGQLGAPQMDEEHLTLGKQFFNGLAYATFAEPQQDFILSYKKRFNSPPALSADNAYDTVYIYKKAIEQVGKIDTQLISEAILEQNFMGASGPIQFDNFGGITKKPIIKIHSSN